MNFQNSSTFKKIILKNDSQTNKLILHVTECVSNKEYGTGSWIFAFCVWIMFFLLMVYPLICCRWLEKDAVNCSRGSTVTTCHPTQAGRLTQACPCCYR
jgi:hypothetical protein